ncbi:MAG TPA: hypothetical protein PLM59_10490, partial [Oscillospiraceae bacterium]|nr:hypothetical protein [Oscillospiraceae bacterium]
MQIFIKKRMLYGLVFLVLFLTALSYPITVKAEAGNYYLSMGEYLSSGKRITSQNGKYFAIMQTDGNFVIYQSDTQKALWHTNTYGGNYTSYRAMMQTDGNFVVYGIKNGAMTALWNAGTHVYGSGTYRLELGDDSVLRVKKNGNTVWNSPNAPINSSGWSYMFREPKMATTITSYRGWRTLNGRREFHPGIDITEYSGGKNLLSSYDYPVYSVNDGYVAVATTSSDGAKYVVLELNDNYTVRYFHLYSYDVTSSTSTKKV